MLVHWLVTNHPRPVYQSHIIPLWSFGAVIYVPLKGLATSSKVFLSIMTHCHNVHNLWLYCCSDANQSACTVGRVYSFRDSVSHLNPNVGPYVAPTDISKSTQE